MRHVLFGASIALATAGCGDSGAATTAATDTGTSATTPGPSSSESEAGTETSATTTEPTGGTATGTMGTDSDPTATTGTSDAQTTDTTEPTDTDTTTTGGPNTKPPDAPDWLVISVSGHCIPPGCVIAGTNHEYLEDEGTAGRFVDGLEAWGFSAQLWSYSDEFYNRDPQTNELLPGEGDPIWLGFLQMYQDLLMVQEEWVEGFEDPTRIMVIAHSHGVVWAHTALLVLPDLPVDVLIDLDGKSLGWEEESLLLDFGDDWDEVIDAYNAEHGVTWPFDLGDAEAGWDIPGQGLMDVEDVVPDSVWHNLEIQAIPGLLMPFPDADNNRRLDGSQDGITRLHSNSEDHMEIHTPNSQGINWALAQFAAIVVP